LANSRPKTGFTLVEVLICISIVAVSFLGVYASIISSQRAVALGQRMSLATGYCRQICEIIRSQGLAYKSNAIPSVGSDLQTPVGVTATPLNQGSDFSSLPGNSIFTRSINTERFSSSGFGYNLYRVTVKVYWKEGARLNHVGMVALARVPLT
jgi:prepilin-type N-terminal cleavage/methylation domain-containing protein